MSRTLKSSWSAYVDESMRQRPDGTGLYVLAAAMLAQAEASEIRETVAMLSNRHRRRVHWRDAEADERHKVIAAVANLDALHLVVVGVRLDLRRQERGRRQCLRLLLHELHAAGVAEVWLESRTQTLNARDMQAVNVFSVQGIIGATPRVGHARPLVEPLLWLPDIVAGAVSTARGDGDEQYLTPLLPLLTEHTIELD